MIEDITNDELEPTFEEFTERLIGQFKKADHFYIVHSVSYTHLTLPTICSV